MTFLGFQFISILIDSAFINVSIKTTGTISAFFKTVRLELGDWTSKKGDVMEYLGHTFCEGKYLGYQFCFGMNVQGLLVNFHIVF
jgi:hypothetical protein